MNDRTPAQSSILNLSQLPIGTVLETEQLMVMKWEHGVGLPLVIAEVNLVEIGR
jgi:hypothetical protein